MTGATGDPSTDDFQVDSYCLIIWLLHSGILFEGLNYYFTPNIYTLDILEILICNECIFLLSDVPYWRISTV